MKRILVSLLSVTVVAGLAIGASQAFFSDTEVSNNNKITAGTIDLEVSTNPTEKFVPVDIQDMKPSYVRWTKHTVRNTGTNPLKLWKRITNLTTSEHRTTDAERDWYAANSEMLDPETGQKNDIDKFIEYDMYIGGDVTGTDVSEANNWFGGENLNGTVVIDEEDGITLYDIEGVYIYLGELQPAGAEGADQMVVWQSYHMKDETENWAQTDTVNFTIEFYGEQVNGTGPIGGGDGPQKLLLENKDPNDWQPIVGDGKWGVLTWAGDGPTFDFSSTLKAHGLVPSESYSLVYAPDPYPQGVASVTTKLGTGIANASGDLEISGSPVLGYDIPHPDEDNKIGGKIWLVLSDDHNGQKMLHWNPDDYLFEYNLITYEDNII